jgi:hypothetical protein
MCISISLPQEFHKFRNHVKIKIVIETLLYRSDLREVVLSFDCVVENWADEPIDLWMSHVDNVKACLGSEDWYSLGSNNPDKRATLVSEIYGECWDFDAASGSIAYRELATVDDLPRSYATVGELLSFHDAAFRPRSLDQINAAFVALDTQPFVVSGRSACAPIFRLRPFPSCGRAEKPNERVLPYTTVRVGPIKPSRNHLGTTFRLTLVIAKDAYTRLVQPEEDALFHIYSSDRLCNIVSDALLPRFMRDPRHDEYQEFFVDEVLSSLLLPEVYQIVVGQPEDEEQGRCILVHPSGSSITQRVIRDQKTRLKALWFNAWSSDFSMVLEYADREFSRTKGFRAKQGCVPPAIQVIR